MRPETSATPPRHFSTLLHPGFLVIHIAISFMFGIASSLIWAFLTQPIAWAIILIFTCLAITYRTRRQSHIFLLICIFGVGMGLGLHHLQPPPTHHIRELINAPTQVTCTGLIQEAPTRSAERVKIILSIATIYTPEPVSPASIQVEQNLFATTTWGKVKLSMKKHERQTKLAPGDTITVQASLSPPRGFVNPGGFNLPFFLKSQNILISGWVPRPQSIIKHSSPSLVKGWHPRIQAEQIRAELISFFNTSLPLENGALYRALITGDRSGLSNETQEIFKNLGIFHLLAISGLHMSLLAGAVMWLSLKAISCFPRLLLHIPAQQGAAVVAIIPVLFYCFISGLHPPAVRACLMTMVLFSGFILRQHWHGPTAIGVAALLILTHNPLLLATVSFQLSFIAVTAIILILPKLKDQFFSKKDPPSRLTTLKATLTSGFIVSIVASIATLPLLLLYFNRVSLISPLTTLIMEPLLCLWGLGFGLAGSLFVFISPPLAKILLQTGSLGLDISLWIGYKINSIPHITLWSSPPAIWAVVLFYITLIIFFIWPNKKSTLSGLAGLALLFLPQPHGVTVDQVSIIDVGKGNSSLIQCTSGEVILIDCGGPNGENFNIGKQVIAPFLWHQQIRKLDLLILSHADLDHYSGAIFLIKRFQPQEIWLPNTETDNELWGEVIKLAKAHHITIRIPEQNAAFPLRNKAHLTSISTAHLTHKNWPENDRSLVIRFESEHSSFIFPGDISRKSEALLIRRKVPLQATVIVAPHHGSKSSSSTAFIDQVNAHYVIFSASGYSKSLFPAPTIVQRYRKANSIPLQTAQSGALIFKLKADELTITTSVLSTVTNEKGHFP